MSLTEDRATQTGAGAVVWFVVSHLVPGKASLYEGNKDMNRNLALILAVAVALSVAQSATADDAKLAPKFHAAFCGDKGNAPQDKVGAHELSHEYSKALVADLKRREGKGLTTATALAAMRSEYCLGNGSKETEK